MTRLEELLRMRDFIDAEIRTERAVIAAATPNRQLVEEIAALYGVDIEDVLSPVKGHLLASRARQSLCWVLRQRGLSFAQVGKVVGRDHSTVQHACKIVDDDSARRALLAPLVLDERRQVAS